MNVFLKPTWTDVVYRDRWVDNACKTPCDNRVINIQSVKSANNIPMNIAVLRIYLWIFEPRFTLCILITRLPEGVLQSLSTQRTRQTQHDTTIILKEYSASGRKTLFLWKKSVYPCRVKKHALWKSFPIYKSNLCYILYLAFYITGVCVAAIDETKIA